MNNEHKIAVISDTHSLIRPEVAEVIQSCEVILHAGDIASKDSFDKISSITRSYFVRGNADKDWAIDIPKDINISLYGFDFYMVHNKKDMKYDPVSTDFVIYGHSHKYEETHAKDVCFINPGSCGPRLFFQDITMAVLYIDEQEHSYHIEKIDLSPVYNPKEISIPAKDMDRLIKSIIKDMGKNKPVAEIADKNHVEIEFVNQILQIYTTHPGIDVYGIMNRVDIWGK